MVETRLVVVGANAAGMSAAHQALRGAKSRDREIRVVALEATGDTSYSACGIPYWLAGDLDDPDDLVARSARKHRAMGVELRTGATAVELDLDRHTIRYRDSEGQQVDLPFDELVLATGASAVIPDWALNESGQLIDGVRPVKHLDDGREWLDLLRGSRSDAAGGASNSRAVVVGGGYIGIEMAETLLRRGLDTTLVTRIGRDEPPRPGHERADHVPPRRRWRAGSREHVSDVAASLGRRLGRWAHHRSLVRCSPPTWSSSVSASNPTPSSALRRAFRSVTPVDTVLTREVASPTACGQSATAARSSTD